MLWVARSAKPCLGSQLAISLLGVKMMANTVGRMVACYWPVAELRLGIAGGSAPQTAHHGLGRPFAYHCDGAKPYRSLRWTWSSTALIASRRTHSLQACHRKPLASSSVTANDLLSCNSIIISPMLNDAGIADFINLALFSAGLRECHFVAGSTCTQIFRAPLCRSWWRTTGESLVDTSLQHLGVY